MSKFNLTIDEESLRSIIYLKVYSISDNCDTLLGNIISLIKNIKRDSFDYEISYHGVRYITNNNEKILYIYPFSLNRKNKRILLVSLINDITVLTECLLYFAIKYEDITAIEYLVSNYGNIWNTKDISDICTDCHVEPLKYILLDYNEKLSLKYLAYRSIRSVCTNIDNLPIPRVLRDDIKNVILLKEIFYNSNKGLEYSCNDNSINGSNKLINYSYFDYRNYINIIQKYGLHNIVNYRLLVKGVKEFNCDIHSFCGNIKNGKKNYILYCEATSYDKSVRNIIYVSITFHIYKYDIYTIASMKCETIEKLPTDYNLVPLQPIYFSITAGSFNGYHKIIENEVFTFKEPGNTYWDSIGYYKINLKLFIRP